MNFLSHYYFERYSHDPELVLGSILPDLLKNAEYDIRLQPRKHETELLANPKLTSLYIGWERHIAADKIFHNTQFFYTNTHELKLRLLHVVEKTPIRPSFLSHIALELLLDHLLLKDQRVSEHDFYGYLASADRESVTRFLTCCGIEDTALFFRFFNGFLRSQYVGNYRYFDQVAQALIAICRRLWKIDSDEVQYEVLAQELEKYASELARSYRIVFDEMEPQLSLYTP